MDLSPDQETTTTTGEYQFSVLDPKHSNTTWRYVGGILCICFAILGFLLSIFSRVDMVSMQMMTTVPILIGIKLIASAWMQERAPLHVAVGPYGVRVSTSRQTDTYTWDRISWAKVQSNALSQRKEFCLYDQQGKILARLDESLQPFEYLTKLTLYYIGLKADPATDQVRTGKAIKNGRMLIAGSVFSTQSPALTFTLRIKHSNRSIC